MAKELRTYIPLQQALEDARNRYGFPEDYGMLACYEVEDMGYCADGETRWYHFISLDGKPAYTLKF